MIVVKVPVEEHRGERAHLSYDSCLYLWQVRRGAPEYCASARDSMAGVHARGGRGMGVYVSPGESLASHMHADMEEVFYFLDGAGMMQIEGKFSQSHVVTG